MRTSPSPVGFLPLFAAALVACGPAQHTADGGLNGGYVLTSVVIDPNNNRTTYAQVVSSLTGPFDNQKAIEIPGNGSVLATRDAFFVGLVEEPTWVKYVIEDGAVKEAGRLSFQAYGVTTIDYGNTIVDDETAVSAFSDPAKAIVWNPKTLTIKGEVSLAHQKRDGYSTEVWTTVAHDGLVYIPARWSDWTGGRIFPGVGLTILDPATLAVKGFAEDDRCASGGRPVFDAAGNAYVLGDGRTYSIQMFANAAGTTPPKNCLLRIKAGEIDFDANYFFEITALTGGYETVGELGAVTDGQGVGYALMFYPEKLPSTVKADSFAFWSESAFKPWRLELGDTPTATEVTAAPFSAIGFTSAALNGKLYSGGAPASDGLSDVTALDPSDDSVTTAFRMEGYFSGLYELKP